MSYRVKAASVALAGLLVASWGGHAGAVVLSLWTFETSPPVTAGPHTADGGVYGASSFASGLHASASTVYSNPVGNGSLESFSSNFWAVGDYYQFSTSTLNYNTISFSWNQTRSSTGPGTFDLQYSTDGVTFTTFLDDYTVPGVTWSSVSPDGSMTTVFGPISAPAAISNLATVYFRLSAQTAPTSTGGTNRIDNVMVEGNLIPEPSSFLLLALGASMLLFVRRLV